MHKTGSSSIQRSLHRARDLEPGYRYVDLGPENANGSLATAFLERPESYQRYKKHGTGKAEVLERRAAIRSRLASELAAANGKTSILSAEVLALFSEDELRELLRFLESSVNDVAAVGYARPPKAYMAARFQQRLQGGSSDLDLDLLYPDYRRLGAFDRVFSRDNVSLWKFDPKRFPEGDVVRDFSARLGFEIPFTSIVRVNESLSRPAVSILFAYRRFGPSFGVGAWAVHENRAIVEALREVKGPKLTFSDSLVDAVLRRNADDLRWAEERLGEDLREPDQGDETAVCSEQDLLTIEPAAVQAFLTAFQRLQELELPHRVTSRFDADPRSVAAAVQACRQAFRESVQGRDGGTVGRRKRRRVDRGDRSDLVIAAVDAGGQTARVVGRGLLVELSDPTGSPAKISFRSAENLEARGRNFRVHLKVPSENSPPALIQVLICGRDEGDDRDLVIDEIQLEGGAAVQWPVSLPGSVNPRRLRLTCGLAPGAAAGKRARVRISRPVLTGLSSSRRHGQAEK